MVEVASSSLTGWDWFVLLVILGSVAVGLWRGLIRTVFGLAGWVLALIGTPLAAPPLIDLVQLAEHPWVVYVLLFLVILVAVRFLGWLLARGIGTIGLGGLDRMLGGAFGIARALLVILLVAAAAHALELDRRAAWRQAQSRPLLDALVALVGPYLPQRASGIRET